MTDTAREQLLAVIDASLSQARAEAQAQALNEQFPGTSPLPPGTPLMADTETASKLFCLNARTLDRLRKDYPDFPTVKVGGKRLYNVFRCWEWFDAFVP